SIFILFVTIQSLLGRESVVRNKKQRILKNKTIAESPRIFSKPYIDYKINKVEQLLEQIKVYPVTKYAVKYLKKYREFSRIFSENSEKDAIVFAEHTPLPEVLMMTENIQPFLVTVYLDRESKNRRSFVDADIVKKAREQAGLENSFSEYYGYFNEDSIGGLMKRYGRKEFKPSNFNYNEIRMLASFVTAVPLNSGTKNLQEKISTLLPDMTTTWDEEIIKAKAFALCSMSYEHKQKSTLARMIEIKNRAEKGEIEIAGHKKFNYKHLIPYIKKYKML
ncbi:MAG: hypothetical protein PHW96_02110, partial [Candidatus Nanoarchaeia archaeon]|nr:hypothetical protein [Candidatus Nanoarchaeia archaeon]